MGLAVVAVPVDQRFPLGEVGFVITEKLTGERFCVIDREQVQHPARRQQARRVVQEAGLDCRVCATAACPFDLISG